MRHKLNKAARDGFSFGSVNLFCARQLDVFDVVKYSRCPLIALVIKLALRNQTFIYFVSDI